MRFRRGVYDYGSAVVFRYMYCVSSVSLTPALMKQVRSRIQHIYTVQTYHNTPVGSIPLRYTSFALKLPRAILRL
jgi:hypothetical protein